MANARTTHHWLAVIAVVQTLTLLAVVGIRPPVAPARAAGIPDAGAQRDQMVDELKGVNARLDKLVAAFNSGEAQVTVKRMPDAPRGR